jgi:ubiquinone/menaquinone biosynthesis C-methylase UbiE
MPGMARFCHILDCIVHKNPDMRILEVGAGTGAITSQLMETLTPLNHKGEKCMPPRYGLFDYTDVSPVFFHEAEDMYRDHGTKMRFRRLDIESDPEAQGFECGTYDMVIAGAVISALTMRMV